ncbi:MAG: carbohydrate kinase [Planctomycetes bacterium]|nr:carbohydrate kinase [Planctomycetota bacterium]
MNPIVGIGELLWDVYPDGRKVAGGAPFNFAYHCHQLGHPAVIVSRVGDDDLGRALRERVRELGLSDEYIQTDRDHPTGTVQVALDANAVPTYTITENVAWDFIAWDEKLADLSERTRSVCFGSLACRGKDSFDVVSEFGRSSHTHRLFDVNLRQNYFTPKLLEWGVARAHWVKISDEEIDRFATAIGVWIDSFEQFHQSLFLPGQLLIITKGAGGCELLWPEHDQHFGEPGVPARVVDTVGAGDAFTAAMVCLHLEGKPLRECARFANHYAARVCEQPGGTPKIDRAEVERAAGIAT